MTSDLTTVEPAEPPIKDGKPQIELTDQEVDEAASNLGYAVIKGRKVKDLKKLGMAVGSDHIHVGRSWLMMSFEACQQLSGQLDEVVKNPDTEGAKENALKLKKGLVDSMVSCAKEMISSGEKTSQAGQHGPTATPGFGHGVPAMPPFALQVNVDTQKKTKSHVQRSNVGSKPGRRDTGSDSDEQGD